MKEVADTLKQWTETNDFYETGILSNSLKLGRLAAEKIRKIVIELEYHGREALAKRLEAEFKGLTEKCRSLDKAILNGCFNEDDYMQLDLKRRRVIGTVIEVAELIELIDSFRGGNCKTSSDQPVENDEWISLSEAGKILGFKPGSVSRLIDKGLINDNGLSNHNRKVSKISVLIEKERRDKMDLNDSANDLRYDTANIKNKRY